jgi:D-3-phosphoglycerate dehydrogenase
LSRVLVVGRVHAAGLERLRAAGLAVEEVDERDPAAIAAGLPGAVAVIVRTAPLPAELLARGDALRMVAKHGVGYDNIAVAALTARRIPCAVAAGANRVAVAEHAIMMLLELAKAARAQDAAVRAGDWAFRDRRAAIELFEKTLLLVGFGRIGREVARRAAAFGMRILAHDPLLPAKAIRAAGAEPAPALGDALAQADAVSLHLPLTPATRHLIDAAALARLRPDAILINTARGGLVDEAALAEALACGALRGAGIDAFAEEPPPPDHPLLRLPNVLLSPHSAGVSREAALRMALQSADNVLAALAGRLDPAVVINPEVLG